MPDYELDLGIRSEGFGCSELGAVHGVDPWKDLHALFVGKFEGMITAPTKRQQYGKHFEDAIRSVASAELGIEFRPSFNKTYRHPEFPKYHLLCTPDALADDPSDGGMETKLAGWDQKDQFGPPDDLVPLIPPRIELQVRGTMEVMQRPKWRIAVWCGSDRLLIYTLERDLEFGAWIVQRAEEIWQRYFEKRERPPIGSDKISTAWLQRKYPKHKRPDLRFATDDEIALLSRYGKLRIEQKALAKERLTLENRLKDAIQDREGLTWEHGLFTWRRTKDSKWVDWESLAISLRTHFIKDDELRNKVTEDHTRTKAGSRRIYFKSDEFTETEEADDAAA